MDHSPGLCGFDEDNELFFSLEAQPTTNVIRVFEERVAQTETKNEKELHSLIQTEIMKSSTQLQETSIQKNDAQNSNKNEVLQSPSTNEESQHLNSKDISTNFKVTTRKKQEISELEQWLQDLELQVSMK
jgi:recombination DNA repair RAD52 pathway protein